MTFIGEHWAYEVPKVTTCKHKKGTCELCGTSDRRDKKHTTKGGVGVVAAAIKKSKRR